MNVLSAAGRSESSWERAMDFSVMTSIYNSYCGHRTLSLIPDFLCGDADSFGPALSELTVTFYFSSTNPPLATLEEMYAGFHANRLTLPKVVFRRKRAQATINIASDLIDGKDWELNRGLSLPLFKAGVVETIAALGLLKKRMTAKDDFKLDAFLTHCDEARSRLPSTAEELAAFAEKCEVRRMARYDAMSPWEKLGIDWRDYHPDARTILDDPFFWDCSDDVAPHGNDTGADLLESYRRWLRKNPVGDPVSFYRALIRKWGYSAASSAVEDTALLDEAAVAVAFAEYKLRADCRPTAVHLAQAAIARQRRQAIEAVDWNHRTERLKSLDLLDGKLRDSRSGSSDA